MSGGLPQAGATTVPALFGAYYTDLASPGDLAAVDAMRSWQGKRNAIVNVYSHWDQEHQNFLFGTQLPTIWGRGSVPIVSWKPIINGDSTTDFDAPIAAGTYDSYIDGWASAMKTWLAGPDGVYGTADDRRAYLRLAHEANGNWYSYSPAYDNSPPGNYIAMWRHVHDRFALQGIDSSRLAWVWSVNYVDSSSSVPARSSSAKERRVSRAASNPRATNRKANHRSRRAWLPRRSKISSTPERAAKAAVHPTPNGEA